MALREVVEQLGEAAYYASTLRFEFEHDRLWKALSPEVRAFCRIAMDKWDEGRPSFKQSYGSVWTKSPAIIDAYQNLSEDKRAEALAFFTYEIHELTHHIDYLITPYGANFHSKLFRQYLAMQDFTPVLLASGQLPNTRLVDWNPEVQNNLEFQLRWKALCDPTVTLEALGDGGMRPRTQHIKPGWAGNTKQVFMLGAALNRVTVRGFLYTLAEPDDPDWYLRPSTILEARAVVHALAWILHLFGGTEAARGPLRLYLDTFYPREDKAHDYRLVLDILASLFESESFYELIEHADIQIINYIFVSVDSACWYALHAPPPMPSGSAIHSNPVIRLIYYLQFMARCHEQKRGFSSAVDAMNAMDLAPGAKEHELRPVGEILTFSRELTNHLRGKVDQIACPIMRAHFDHILTVQERRFAARIPHGYTSRVGMPDTGHPALGLRTEAEVADLAFDAYKADQKVIDWFRFRHNIVYSFMQPAVIDATLRRFFPAATTVELPTMRSASSCGGTQ
jgi:hypothetical protein